MFFRNKLFFAVFFILLIAGVGLFFFNNSLSNNADNSSVDIPGASNQQAGDAEGCVSNSSPQFSHYPTDIENIIQFSPPVMELGGSVKAHGYTEVSGKKPVYAPTDSTLFAGAKYEASHPDLENDQYLLHFRVSCEVFYYYDHLIDPVEKIAKFFPEEPQNHSRTKNIGLVEFEAGELVGYSRDVDHGHRFDFGVINNSLEPILAVYPEYENSEKAYPDCPIDYFPGEMRERLAGLMGYERFNSLELIDNLCE